jgi:hypothetical protein
MTCWVLAPALPRLTPAMAVLLPPFVRTTSDADAILFQGLVEVGFRPRTLCLREFVRGRKIVERKMRWNWFYCSGLPSISRLTFQGFASCRGAGRSCSGKFW